MFACGPLFSDLTQCTSQSRKILPIRYVTHFKCNKKRLIQYHNIWEYTKEIYQMHGISETVNMEHIKSHYYMSHIHINPFGSKAVYIRPLTLSVVPIGFEVNFSEHFKRDHLHKE